MRRMIDVAFSLTAMALLAVPALALAACSAAHLGSPVLYRQTRLGKGNRPFTLYKFRSMRPETDKNGRPLSDSERLGRYGKFIRRWKIDELPQLFNLLKGDLTIFGPRPMQEKHFTPLYKAGRGAKVDQRHSVKPGLLPPTAFRDQQILQSYAEHKDPLRYEEDRIDVDLEYIAQRQRSARADLIILKNAFNAVARQKGADNSLEEERIRQSIKKDMPPASKISEGPQPPAV